MHRELLLLHFYPSFLSTDTKALKRPFSAALVDDLGTVTIEFITKAASLLVREMATVSISWSLYRFVLSSGFSLSLFGRVWHAGHAPFALVGSDTFIIVSPRGNVLWTCDPNAILQFSKRHHDFVKPVETLGMLNMYGPTITGTEGEESRLYRKIAGPSFNDRTHSSVWTETLSRTAVLLQTWRNLDTPLMQLNKDLAKLTLHVISSVCFDRQMEWAEAKYPDTPTGGHHLTYQEAIGTMLDSIPILFTVPMPIISE